MSELKQRVRNILPKNAFARGVSVLVGGTVGAQALMVLASPLLTRLYSPEDFGLLAVFTAVLAFLTVISAGRYDLAIPLPKADQDAANLAVLAVCVVSIITFISFIVFLLWSHEIAQTLNAPALSDYLLLIPVGVFFIGLYQIFSKWAVRQKQFGVIAKTTLYQSIATLSVQLGGYIFGPVSLIVGHAAGQGVGATSLVRSALRKKEFKNFTVEEIRVQATRYKDFPLYSTGTAVLNTASLQLAPIVFIALYGATVAGLYALTLRILSMPISLVGNAIGSVFLSEAPEAKRNGTLAKLIVSLHSKLSLIGALPLAILLFFGPDLFVLVFGEAWRKAGTYAQWMAPWIYLQLQWSPLSILASVLELQRAALISQLLTFICRFGVLFLTWFLTLSADSSILMFAIVSAVTYLFRMLWFTRKASVSSMKLLFVDVKHVFLALILIGIIWFYV